MDASPYFKDVNDILKRYEALMQARSIVLTRQEVGLATLENAKMEIVSTLN